MNDDASTMSMAAPQLKAFIERIENLEDEKAAVADQIKEVYAESKAGGFDTKTIRKIIALRKLTDAEVDEAEALLQLYQDALTRVES